jgi:hypothetical protein
LVGDGEGLPELVRDRDGDGLGERDLDGLGLLLAVGLVEVPLVGLDEPDGLGDTVLVGLGLLDALAVGLPLTGMASKFAASTASELCPHGEAIGRDDEASAGASAKPDARNDPAARLMAMRPARVILSGTGALRSWGQLLPNRAAGTAPYPQP